VGLGLENPLHIAIVLVVVLLVFGAKKLPEMGRGLGQGMREFKDGITGQGVDTTAPAVPEQVADRERMPGP
jgi:sec-independent protein translocase protein TatA